MNRENDYEIVINDLNSTFECEPFKGFVLDNKEYCCSSRVFIHFYTVGIQYTLHIQNFKSSQPLISIDK